MSSARSNCAASRRISASPQSSAASTSTSRAGRAPCHHRTERRRQVHAVQPDQRLHAADARAASCCDGEVDRRVWRPIEINRRGLSRSFQVTNIFPRMSVCENMRCGVLWSLGYRYAFWNRIDRLPRSAASGPSRCWRTSTSPRGATCRRALLTYAEQRALEIGITIAGGADVILLDEPTAGMSHSETEHAVALIRRSPKGKHAGHGRARHERGVRPRRPHLGAGLRRGHRHRTRRRIRGNADGAGSLSRRRRRHDARGRDLHAYYGKSHILQGVDLHVGDGEIVSLLGRNGVGRSTTVKAIMGHVPPLGHDPFKGERDRRPAAAPDRPCSGSATCPRTATSFPTSPCGRIWCSA